MKTPACLGGFETGWLMPCVQEIRPPAAARTIASAAARIMVMAGMGEIPCLSALLGYHGVAELAESLDGRDQ